MLLPRWQISGTDAFDSARGKRLWYNENENIEKAEKT